LPPIFFFFFAAEAQFINDDAYPLKPLLAKVAYLAFSVLGVRLIGYPDPPLVLF
jgi:hypothetical protein